MQEEISRAANEAVALRRNGLQPGKLLILSCGEDVDNARRVLISLVMNANEVRSLLDDQAQVDLRMAASGVLTRYRVIEGRDAIWKLFLETRKMELIANLALLHDPRASDFITSKVQNFSQHADLFDEIGLLKIEAATASLSDLYGRLENVSVSRDTEKLGLAWTLYQLTSDPKYADLLLENLLVACR